MLLPDVTVLLFAYRRESDQHEDYARWLSQTLAAAEVGLVQTVLLGFVHIVTNPRMMSDPAPTPVALRSVDAVLAAPRARLLEPTAATWDRLRSIAGADDRVRGPLVPDAWIAALALSRGRRVATADRGFGRYAGLDWFVPVGTA